MRLLLIHTPHPPVLSRCSLADKSPLNLDPLSYASSLFYTSMNCGIPAVSLPIFSSFGTVLPTRLYAFVLLSHATVSALHSLPVRIKTRIFPSSPKPVPLLVIGSRRSDISPSSPTRAPNHTPSPFLSIRNPAISASFLVSSTTLLPLLPYRRRHTLMPRSSSKSKSKSLPPLPIVAAHIGAGSSASAANPPAHAPSNNNNSTEDPESATTATRRRTCAVTNGCIRTTVTLLVFGAYLVWTWPWHREHGFEGVPWVGGRGRPRDRGSSVMWMGTGIGMGVGVGMSVEVEGDGILRAPELGVPEEIQMKWGQYAPYRAMGRYVGTPEGCRVTQVSSLSLVSSFGPSGVLQVPSAARWRRCSLGRSVPAALRIVLVGGTDTLVGWAVLPERDW